MATVLRCTPCRTVSCRCPLGSQCAMRHAHPPSLMPSPWTVRTVLPPTQPGSLPLFARLRLPVLPPPTQPPACLAVAPCTWLGPAPAPAAAASIPKTNPRFSIPILPQFLFQPSPSLLRIALFATKEEVHHAAHSLPLISTPSPCAVKDRHTVSPCAACLPSSDSVLTFSPVVEGLFLFLLHLVLSRGAFRRLVRPGFLHPLPKSPLSPLTSLSPGHSLP